MSTKEEKSSGKTKGKKRKGSTKGTKGKGGSKKSKKEEKKSKVGAKSKKEINDSKFCQEVMKNLEEGIFFGGWYSGVQHAVHRPSNIVNVLKRFQEFVLEEKLSEIFYVNIEAAETGDMLDMLDMESKRVKEIMSTPEEQQRLSRALRKTLAEVAYKGINRITLARKHAVSPLFASFNQICAGGDKLCKGSKANSVVYYAPRAKHCKKPEQKKPEHKSVGGGGGGVVFGDSEEKLVLNRANVFGMDKVSGGTLSAHLKQLQSLWTMLMPAFAPLEAAEELMKRVLTKYGPKIEVETKEEGKGELKEEAHGQLKLEHDATGCGYYCHNVIHLAPRGNYPPEEYYSTFFHELGHYMDGAMLPNSTFDLDPSETGMREGMREGRLEVMARVLLHPAEVLAPVKSWWPNW